MFQYPFGLQREMLSTFMKNFEAQTSEESRTQLLVTSINDEDISYDEALSIYPQLRDHQRLALIGLFAPYSTLLHQNTKFIRAIPELLKPDNCPILSSVLEGLKTVITILFLFIFWLPPCQADCGSLKSQTFESHLDMNILHSIMNDLKTNLTSLDELKTFKTSQKCSNATFLHPMNIDNYTEISNVKYENLTWKIDTSSQDSYLFYVNGKSCHYTFLPKMETLLLNFKKATTGTINQAFENCLSFTAPEKMEPFKILESKLHIFSCYETCFSEANCKSYHYSHIDKFCRLYKDMQGPAKILNPRLISANVTCRPFYIQNEPQILFSSKLVSARSKCKYSTHPQKPIHHRCLDDYFYLEDKVQSQIKRVSGYENYILDIYKNRTKRGLDKTWPSVLDVFSFIDTKKIPSFLQKGKDLFKMVSKNQNLINDMLFSFQTKVLRSRPQHLKHLKNLTFNTKINGSQIYAKVAAPQSCPKILEFPRPEVNHSIPEQQSFFFDFYFFKVEFNDLVQYTVLFAFVLCFFISCICRKCNKKKDLNGITYKAADTEDDAHATPGFWASLKFQGPGQDLPPPPNDL